MQKEDFRTKRRYIGGQPTPDAYVAYLLRQILSTLELQQDKWMFADKDGQAGSYGLKVDHSYLIRKIIYALGFYNPKEFKFIFDGFGRPE